MTDATDPLPSAPLPSANVFRHRDFAVFWGSRVASTLANQVESVAMGWQVYSIARRTHDVPHAAFYVGMIGLAAFLPLFLLTLSGGEAADRHDRRTIGLVCCAVQSIGVAILAVASFSGAALPDLLMLWLVFAVAASFGASRAFLGPAITALAPMLVAREELPRAIAWTSLGQEGGAIAGPAISGLLCAIAPAWAYAAATVLFGLSFASLLLIRGKTRPQAPTGSRWALIVEGLSYVWGNKIVLGAITLDLFAVILGGVTALLPVYARDVLHAGSSGFGVLRAAPSVGAAVMAATLGRFPIHRHAGLWMFGAVAVYAMGTLGFAVSRAVWFSVALLVLLGAADMISMFIRQSLVQLATPDPMRGRVSAVSGVFVSASNELGEFETGVVASLLGPVGAAVFGGVGSLMVTGGAAAAFPTLRKADRLLEVGGAMSETHEVEGG